MLSVLMLIPSYFGFLGVYGYYRAGNTLYKSESLIVVELMSIFSLYLVIPYLISYFYFKHRLSRAFKFFTSLPFIVMLVITIYAGSLGITW